MFTDPGPVGRLGRLVRRTRIAQGLRQEDLARRCEIATATLRRIEKGDGTGPSVFVVVRLFHELGLELDRLEALATTPGPPNERFRLPVLVDGGGPTPPGHRTSPPR